MLVSLFDILLLFFKLNGAESPTVVSAQDLAPMPDTIIGTKSLLGSQRFCGGVVSDNALLDHLRMKARSQIKPSGDS